MKKKTVGVIIASVLAAVSLCVITSCAVTTGSSIKTTRPTLCASVEETASKLKVFVGDTVNAPADYIQQRAAFVSELATTNQNTTFEALIGLNDYYTTDAVTDWAKNYDTTIHRVYMWPKGETGRLSLHIENNDIGLSLENYKQDVEAKGYCEDKQFAKDYQRLLNGEYEVFALLVTATAGELEAINSEADCLNYIDVMYNTEAEAYAQKVGKRVSYIQLPAKPDGVG